ncbi:putative rhoptry neck protein [Toxoplasma gondii VEG]|uniref:Rhoptry neck protein n=2 Tax=Toxoplasma gondii TaxID=5811 RepID=V4ZEK4_TOXGV|nr:putative rhoptry neck protein [Toxoplasma gondii VEG]KFG32721.1 putative rhoptry neck protein [Toxoplasma gondii p89]
MSSNLAFLSLSLAESTASLGKSLEETRTRLTEKLKLVAGMALGFDQFAMHQTATGPGLSVEGKQTEQMSRKSAEDTRASSLSSDPDDGRAAQLAGQKGHVTPCIAGLIATSNPFLFTHMLALGAAYLGYDKYFGDGTSELLPFYGTRTLLSTLSPLDTPRLLDSMAAADRLSPKRSILSRFSRRKRSLDAPAPEPSGWDQKRKSRLPLGSLRLVLDILDRHLEALTTYVQQQIEIFRQAGVPLEASVTMTHNLNRLHVTRCQSRNNQMVIPCRWKDTTFFEELSNETNPGLTDEEQLEKRVKFHKLENAFNTVTGLGALEAMLDEDSVLLGGPAEESVARLYSDFRLGAAMNNWYFYDALNINKMLSRFQKVGTKVLKQYGLENLMNLATSHQAGSTASWDRTDIDTKLAKHHHYGSALRVRLYIMALLPQFTPHREGILSPVDFIREAFAGERSYAMSTARLKPLLSDDLVILGVPKGFSFLWLFEFLLEEDSPNALVAKRRALKRIPNWTKRLFSHSRSIPMLFRQFYKALNAGVFAKARRRTLDRSKTLLSRQLPEGWRDIVMDAFTFTAHSAALMQVVNYHSLFRDRTLNDLQEASYLATPPAFSIEDQSVMKRCDEQIYEWSRFGFSPDVLEADLHNETFKGKWENLRLETMPTPDTHQWWRRLHRAILDSLEIYQAHERHLKGMSDNLYTLVEDTIKNLQDGSSRDDTIFFGRIARGARESVGQKMWRGVKTFFLDLVRDVPGSDHAVWFGVGFNFPRIFQILRKMKEIALHAAGDQGSAILLDEAFVELVQETVAVRAQTFRRQPPTTLRNIGVIGLRPDYANLDTEQRSMEYQLSMCADHCVSLWEQILGFIYPYVLNPSLLTDYEKSFGTGHAIKKLDDPSYVNSFRYIFANDASLNFFEHNTPQDTRKALVSLKSGQAFMYANMMRFAGIAFEQLSMPYLAVSLQRQAPFMGQMVKDWVAKRSRSRKLAIVSVLSLGLIFAYTLLSALDIAQFLTDSGMKAIEDCSWNPIMQQMACVVVAGSGSLVAPTFAALSDVFKVGLYSGIGSTLIAASVVGNAYMIIRSQSRTILRTEMAIKNVAVKLWKQMRKYFSWVTRFTKRRKAILSTMMARATALAKNKKPRSETAATMTRSGDSVMDMLLQGVSPATPQRAQDGSR